MYQFRSSREQGEAAARADGGLQTVYRRKRKTAGGGGEGEIEAAGVGVADGVRVATRDKRTTDVILESILQGNKKPSREGWKHDIGAIPLSSGGFITPPACCCELRTSSSVAIQCCSPPTSWGVGGVWGGFGCSVGRPLEEWFTPNLCGRGCGHSCRIFAICAVRQQPVLLNLHRGGIVPSRGVGGSPSALWQANDVDIDAGALGLEGGMEAQFLEGQSGLKTAQSTHRMLQNWCSLRQFWGIFRALQILHRRKIGLGGWGSW